MILSSDNGYIWGEHGRWEKFVPYEPSIRVPLLVRWPGHIAAGTDTTGWSPTSTCCRRCCEAAGVTPARPARPRWTASRSCRRAGGPRCTREYYVDGANPNIPSWRMVRTSTVKYVHTYNAQGAIIAREYYNLTNDPAENTNLLGDATSGNDPPAAPSRTWPTG